MITASFIVSLLALAGSLVIGIRQIQTSRGASHLNLSMAFLSQYFDGGFADSEEFVQTQISRFDDGTCTLLTLPEAARIHAIKVAGLYQMLGHLSVSSVIDGDTFRYLLGVNAVKSWQALSPFILRGRGTDPSSVGYRFFEDLAARCAKIDSATTVRRFRLMEMP
jgi:hypothetical protein